jgi:hypothetical protein
MLAVAGAYAKDADLETTVGLLIAAEKAYAKLAGEKGFRKRPSPYSQTMR